MCLCGIDSIFASLRKSNSSPRAGAQVSENRSVGIGFSASPMCLSVALKDAVVDIMNRRHRALPYTTLQVIAAQLEHDLSGTRKAAVQALQGQVNLTDKLLQHIAERLENDDIYVRRAAIRALQGRVNLTDKSLQRIAARLEHEDNVTSEGKQLRHFKTRSTSKTSCCNVSWRG